MPWGENVSGISAWIWAAKKHRTEEAIKSLYLAWTESFA
jgi:hypothetical protein